MKKLKIILLTGFLLLAVGIGYLIQTRIGWGNFKRTMEDNIRPHFVKDEDAETNSVTEKDTILQGGYTLIEKFDKNLEPFPDDEMALYMYYKFPSTKEFKEEEHNKPMPENLQAATMQPTDEDAAGAFQMNMEGRLADLVERGLRFHIGKCYKNDKTDIYENKPCVTCNVIVFTPNKEDAVKIIHVFGESSYDFYYDESSYPAWKVTDATMNIPFEYEMYGKYSQYLKELGYKFQKSEMFHEK